MRRSWLTIVLGPAVLLVLIVLPFLIYRGDVPDPMAIHWGPTGEPDGSMQPIFAVVLLGGIFVAMVFAVHRALRPAPEEAPSFLAGLFGVGGLLAAVSWLAFLANRDQASWEQATEVGLLQILGAVVVGLVVGFIGWLLAGGRSASRPRPVGVAPTLEVADPENTVWSGRGVGKLTVAVGLVVIVIALIAWGWTAVLLGLVGIVALAFAEVRATVGQRGVLVSMGWWGFPSWTVPLESIVRAEVETVSPMSYGGWGYRLRPGVRAVVVRGGESLRLVRDEATDLVLTVDDAETGAGLINAMLGATAS